MSGSLVTVLEVVAQLAAVFIDVTTVLAAVRAVMTEIAAVVADVLAVGRLAECCGNAECGCQ